MPLQTYHISPVNVSNTPITDQGGNDLECVTNNTLANLIRQIGSLGENSTRVFESLSKDARKLNERTKEVNRRIQGIIEKSAKLDSEKENSTKLKEFYVVEHFKSSVNFDQQIFTKMSFSDAMRTLYENADAPPALSLLDEFRDDGVESLKLYSDPGYFFDYWKDGLIKENETRRIERKNKQVGQLLNESILNDMNFSKLISYRLRKR